MQHFTWWSALLLFITVFFGGMTAQAHLTGHRARGTLLWLFLVLLFLTAILGQFAAKWGLL